MIESKELRINNIVYSNLEQKEVVLNGVNKIHGMYGDSSFHSLDGFKPIPITEEWLLEFGFTPTTCSDKPIWSENYHDLTYYDLKLSKDKYTDLSLLSSYIENENITVELFPYEVFKYKYVHQLQNLYFALTNEELTIK